MRVAQHSWGHVINTDVADILRPVTRMLQRFRLGTLTFRAADDVSARGGRLQWGARPPKCPRGQRAIRRRTDRFQYCYNVFTASIYVACAAKTSRVLRRAAPGGHNPLTLKGQWVSIRGLNH